MIIMAIPNALQKPRVGDITIKVTGLSRCQAKLADVPPASNASLLILQLRMTAGRRKAEIPSNKVP